MNTADKLAGLKRLPLVIIAVSLVPGEAFALPDGLVVKGGVIGVSQSDPSSLLIQQGSDRAAGDWRSFNIGAGERVTVQQPSATSLMLARVTGGVGTEIFGQLHANGGLILINPHGVLIGSGATINTASFAASTLNVDPNRFMGGGSVAFEKLPEAPLDAAVINRGTISVADAGLVALISPQVINEGLIMARLGTIQLASGTTATLDLAGDGLYQVALDPSVSASLLNQGQLQAQYVRIGASEAQALLHAAVNLDGLIQARGPGDSGGSITVATGGDLKVNGVVDASGGATAKGGSVKLLADRIALLDQARVNASGGSGGGEVLIGGNLLGKGPEPNARVAVITSGAEVKADALNQGDGGRVILWSDQYTGFYGNISARGGANGGHGGFVETSSKNNLQAWGRVDASAPLGNGGEWLLDPADVTISAASTSLITSDAGNPNVFTPATDTGNPITNPFTANINLTALVDNLYGGTSVTIRTTGGNASTPGNISFKDDISYENNTPQDGTTAGALVATLKLIPHNDVVFEKSLALRKVDVIIEKDPTTSGATVNNVTFQTGGVLHVRSFTSKDATGLTQVNVLNTYGPGGVDIKSATIELMSTVRSLPTSASFVSAVGPIRLEAIDNINLLRDGTKNSSIDSSSTIDLNFGKLTAAQTSGTAANPIPITAAGKLTFDCAQTTCKGAVIDGGLALKSTSGAIEIKNVSVDGVAGVSTLPDSLSLNAFGGVLVNQKIGGVQPLNNLVVVNSAGTKFSDNVAVAALKLSGSDVPDTGLITLSNTSTGNAITFLGDLQAVDLVTANQGYQVELLGASTKVSKQVDFLNTGLVTLGNSSGTDVFTFSGGLSFSGNAPVQMDAKAIQSDSSAIDFGSGGLSLKGHALVQTNNSGNGAAITFGGTVAGAGLDLTLNAGSAGTIAATGVDAAGAINLGTLTITAAAAPSGGLDRGVSIAGNLRLASLKTTQNPYNVSLTGASNTFTAAVDFLNTGTVTLGNGGDTFTFDQGLTFSNNPSVRLGSTIQTPAKSVDFGSGAVTLLGDTSINTTFDPNNAGANDAGASVVFKGTVDSDAAVGRALTITAGTNAGSAVTFAAAIGGIQPLGAITVNSSGTTSFGSTVSAASVLTDAPGTAELKGDITTTGAAGVTIQETGSIALGTNLTIDSSAGNGEVVLGTGAAVVESDQTAGSSNARALTIRTGTGNATVASLGTTANKALGAITINSSGRTTFGGAVKAASVLTDAAGTAELKGDITTTGAAGVTIQETGSIALGTNLTIDSSAGNGEVVLGTGAAVVESDQTAGSSNARALTIRTGTGNATVASLGTTANKALGAITINSSGRTTFGGAVKAASVLTDAAGTAELKGDITTTGAAGVTIQETGSIALGTNLTIDSSAGNGEVVLGTGAAVVESDQTAGSSNARALTIRTGTGNATVASLGTTANKALGAITINSSGRTTFGGAVKAASVLTDAAGTAELKGDITTTGAAGVTIQETGSIALGTNLTIDSSAGNGEVVLGTGAAVVESDQTAGSSNARALTIRTGTGNATVASLGTTANKALGAITINSSGRTTFGGAVKAASVLTDAAGTAELKGDITTTGAAGVTIQETGSIALGTNLTIDSSAGNGEVVLGTGAAVVESDQTAGSSNARALTIRTGTGNATVASLGTTANKALGAITINSSGKTTFGGAVKAASVLTDAAGTAELKGDITTTGAAGVTIQETGSIALGTNLTIDSSAGNGEVVLGTGAAVVESDQTAGSSNARALTIRTGTGNATVASLGTTANKALGAITINSSGKTTFGGAVKAASVLTDAAGTAELKGDITTTGAAGVTIQETGSIALGTNLTIDSSAGNGEVVLGTGAAVVESDQTAGSSNARALTIRTGTGNATVASLGTTANKALGAITINSSGRTTFGGAVKAASVLTDAAGTAELSGASIEATDPTGGGVQILENTITLAADVAITSAGHVILSSPGGAIDSQSSANRRSLTISATNPAANNVTLEAALGGIHELGAIQVTTAGHTAFNATVRALSVETDQPGTASLKGDITVSGPAGVHIRENLVPQAVTLNSSVTITSLDPGGAVIVDGDVNSDVVSGSNPAASQYRNLTVKGLGDIKFGGGLGDVYSLGNLVLTTVPNSGKTISVAGNTFANNVTMTASTLSISGDVTSPGFGNPANPNGYHTFKGDLVPVAGKVFQGNIGFLNGVRYGDNTTLIGAVPWTHKYNEGPTPPPLNPDLPPELLTYQLDQNSLSNSVLPAGLPPSPPVLTRSIQDSQRDPLARAIANGKVCLLLGDDLCIDPIRLQSASAPPPLNSASSNQ